MVEELTCANTGNPNKEAAAVDALQGAWQAEADSDAKMEDENRLARLTVCPKLMLSLR